MSEAIESQRTGRRCVFCGQDAVSHEHLFSDWLQDVLPGDDPAVHFRQIGKGEERQEWIRRPFREKSRVVCSDCNHGWMSDLEGAARPILEGPIRREPTRLGASAQTVAATWAFKTCLIFQASQTPEAIAPAGHFSHLYLNGLPPRNVHMWIGSHYRARDDPQNSIYIQRPLALKPLDDKLKESARTELFGYLCFLAIGGLSFLILGSRFGNRTEVTYEGSVAEALIKLWPVEPSIIFWPPPYMMDRDFIDTLTLPPSAFRTRIWPDRA